MFRPDPKPEPRKKEKKGFKKRQPTGEFQLFQQILIDRLSMSQISHTPIYNPTPTNFLHVLPKAQGKYPHFKLYTPNIIIGTPEEHHLWDHERSKIDFDMPGWAMMLALEEALKELYALKYPK